MSAQFLLHPPPPFFPPNPRQTEGKSKGGGEDNWGLVHIWPDKFETEHDFLFTVILTNYTYVNQKRAFQNALRSSLFLAFFFKCARQRIPLMIVAFLNSSGVEWMVNISFVFWHGRKPFAAFQIKNAVLKTIRRTIDRPNNPYWVVNLLILKPLFPGRIPPWL